MIPNPSPLERAFELAGSGRCTSVNELKKQLKREGYSICQIEGRQIVVQLTKLISASCPRADGNNFSSSDA
jgi:hypothetical protein